MLSFDWVRNYILAFLLNYRVIIVSKSKGLLFKAVLHLKKLQGSQGLLPIKSFLVI